MSSRRTLAFFLVLAFPFSARAGGDFNGDGYDDAAIGSPGDRILGFPTGSVAIVYGASFGFDTFGSFFQQQHVTAMHFGLAPNLGDRFGEALAIGDFDGDGFDDLAIGIPGRDLHGATNAGAVGVVYGAPNGLDFERVQLWTQDSPGIKDRAEGPTATFDEGDEFGAALVAADFTGAGRDDLAIGIPREDVEDMVDAGAVAVLKGNKKGLSKKGNLFLTRATKGVPGDVVRELLGDALAAGDFDADGRADLAIGAAQHQIEGVAVGQIIVLPGSKQGPRGKNGRSIDPVADFGAEAVTMYFGNALAAGDFDDDGADDLAIAATGLDVAGVQSAGAVFTVMGVAGSGLDPSQDDSFNENGIGTGLFEPFDQFGRTLASGDFDSDGRDDLAIGVPFAAVNGLASAGEVIVLRGGFSGLTQTNFEIWSQATPTVQGMEEEDDRFGLGLATGDFDGDGAQDLLVGCPTDSIHEVEEAGAVIVLYGDEGGMGLMATGNEALTPGESVACDPSFEARFGTGIGQ